MTRLCYLQRSVVLELNVFRAGLSRSKYSPTVSIVSLTLGTICGPSRSHQTMWGQSIRMLLLNSFGRIECSRHVVLKHLPEKRFQGQGLT